MNVTLENGHLTQKNAPVMIKSRTMLTGRESVKHRETSVRAPSLILVKMIAQVAVIMGGLLVAASYAGRYFDGVFAIRPWATLAFVLIAFSAGLVAVYRIGMSASAQYAPVFTRSATITVEKQN